MLDQNLQQFYQSRLKEGKTTSEQSGWPGLLEDGANPVWHLFDELFQFVDTASKPSILDLGCGTGSMVQYLKEKQLWDKVTYHGIDIVPSVVDSAKKSFPFASFSCQDILETPLTTHYDWVLLNGTFNYMPKPHSTALIHRLIQASFAHSKIGTAFTVSSDFAFRVHPHYQLSSSFLCYENPSKLLAFCRDITPHISLFHAKHFLNVSTFVLQRKGRLSSQKKLTPLQENLMSGHYAEILKDTQSRLLTPQEKWIRVQALLNLHHYREMFQEFVQLLEQGNRPFSHYSYSLSLPKVDMHYMLELIEFVTRKGLWADYPEHIEAFLAYLPDDALRAGVQGLAAFTKKDYASAILSFQTALATYPAWVLVREHLAQLYEAQLIPEKALFEYETILAINPEEPRMLTRYILLLIDQKEWEKILKTLETYPENDFIRDCREMILNKLKGR